MACPGPLSDRLVSTKVKDLTPLLFQFLWFGLLSQPGKNSKRTGFVLLSPYGRALIRPQR
jgi:hypothetical protein